MLTGDVGAGEGLSPRVRGNQLGRVVLRETAGSIPACAGEPRRGSDRGSRTGVYPRVCGGTCSRTLARLRSRGLSPRVRGNPGGVEADVAGSGSIPACAGEPVRAGGDRAGGRVYPRVCGGTGSASCCAPPQRGLSPRVRGNQPPPRPATPRHGSIPACAGEPRPPPGGPLRRRVYPRVCGGTRRPGAQRLVFQGLSPRVRGNRTCRVDVASCRSVYPRVCGGTPWVKLPRLGASGLSPRVRGNRPGPGLLLRRTRSIPACAGEPGPKVSAAVWPGVYPRVCGGTMPALSVSSRVKGLSPRVRGNLHAGDDAPDRLGSIPACAGEPGPSRATWGRTGVYPRVCGGTDPSGKQESPNQGLSPRVRGNLVDHHEGQVSPGSIPACAGEPARHEPTRHPHGVYPRVCGGTFFGQSVDTRRIGLSPRVRGNLDRGLRGAGAVGSIPACAGEPHTATG